MSNCSSGCRTKDHSSYGECLRDKNMSPLWVGPDNNMSTQKKWQDDINAFRTARSQGIRPDGSRREQVDAAVTWSEKNGKPYKARGREDS